MKNYLFKKRKINILVAFLVILFFAFSCKGVSADADTLFDFSNYSLGNLGGTSKPVIDVGDFSLLKEVEAEAARQAADDADKNLWEKFLLSLKKSGSKALSSSLRNALNKIAMDTATYIGSGGRGQKPLFITEGWGEYLGNIGDEAAGEFIEKLGRDKSFYGEFNLCQPDIGVQVKIGLGLVEQSRPSKPQCTFTKMKSNWENELSRQDFLYRFKNMFDPEGNELLQAFTMHANLIGEKDLKGKIGELARTETKGWIDVTNLAGDRVGTPGSIEREEQAARDLYAGNFGEFTGDALVDASNVFLNQLAITAFQTAMRKLGEGKSHSTQPYDWSSLTDFEAGRFYGGITGTKDRLNNIIEPKFSVRGDYDILAELTMCPDPTKAGPTNCVITDRFRQAVGDMLTVGEAVDQGYINRDSVFGFRADGIEPMYNEGFPYRSMIILRKFRILPVGWELAAQKIKDDGGKTYNIQDMLECFKSNDDYDGFYKDWCDGLVDPNWVLKAPLNYCSREGPGPEILFESVSGVGEDSKLNISRNDNYCADEQSCIDENNDGSCNIYGYCTEERRKWSFGSDSCDPKYNTCQTFMASNGSKMSYLENTLNVADCSSSNAGCSEYFIEADSYDANTNNIVWKTGNADPVLYFDRDASECSDENEGCTQFIRTKEGTGSNLLPNSSFEDGQDILAPVGTIDTFDFWGNFGEGNNDSLDGYLSLELAPGNTSLVVPVGPLAYDVAGEIYVLSVFAKDCTTGTVMGFDEGIIPGSGIATTTIGTSDEWTVYRVVRSYPNMYFSNEVEIFFDVPTGGFCLIDAIKLERGDTPTRYSSYMDTGLVYEKMIPKYLYTDCYQGADAAFPNYELKADRPLECDTYSRFCMEDEVGCNLFTSIKDNISVPAKVSAQDYCPDACVGYDVFIQSETAFDSLQDQYFIPNTARTCSANYVGCDEFTNLDKVDEGGEAREYYTSLKQCIKLAGADCGEYYTWEGSKETGYQLKVFSLKNDSTGTEPAVVSNDSAECNEEIHYASSTSPLYNPDCREYYAKSGIVYYHLNSKVITCSDNCHPYRRSGDNVVKQADGSDYDQTTCEVTLGYDFDTDNNYCVECINGGEWASQHNACIYMAIPKEGETCVASQAGCREYGGNSGRNTKIILNSNFEGTVQEWASNGTTIDISNESLMVGGNSLSVLGGSYQTSYEIGYGVKQEDAYVLSFIAKGANNIVTLDFNFENSLGSSTSFSESVILNVSSWGIYEINLLSLNHEVDNGEKLVITGDNDFYIDDIRLTNIRDRYYLLKNSWVMPEINGKDICNWDILVNGPFPQYSLFCEQYTDKDNKAYSLRRFTNLCQESAVGCELMIDTHNSDYFGTEEIPYALANPSIPDTVLADEYVYAVYNEEKLCDSDNEGCQRMGKATIYEGQVLTQDFYIKNNPDKYETTICSASATECREWSINEGLTYFKDPGDQVCEWRQGTPAIGKIESWEWYKKKVKRCDLDLLETDPGYGIIGPGEVNVCLSDEDCPVGTCIFDENDILCSISNVETFGYGGAGKVVSQPIDDLDGYWAGICPTNQSGCSEFIDPVSSFSPNLVFNGDFVQNIDASIGDTVADGWLGNSQNINLESYTLYLLTAENNAASLSSLSSLYLLDNQNNLTTVSPGNMFVNGATNRNSQLFFTNSNSMATIVVSDSDAGNGGVVELKKVAIDYQIDIGVDMESCNGQVSFKDGCILFNKREFNQETASNYSSLNYDADLTADPSITRAPESSVGGNDSNILLKVRPDRECDKWLSCKSYIKDENDNDVCYDIGLCDALDDNGNCKNFVVNGGDPINQIYSAGFSGFSNKSGYAKASYQGTESSFGEPNDYYLFEEMNQVGEKTKTINGTFEMFSTEGYPISWSNALNTNIAWNKNHFRVIKNPVESQNIGVGSSPEGKAYLSMGPGYEVVSSFIGVNPDTSYVLSAFINTLKINSGSAYIAIKQYNSNDVLQSVAEGVSLDYGEKWTKMVHQFDTLAEITKIRIHLYSTGSPNSNFYFDDIQLKPALNSKDNYYTTQECRLYPNDDSLSCEYVEDSGAKQKGWYGYCLEHDTYPGNEDACLLWWPIDNVKGEGYTNDNFGGYLGKTPVYYCTEGAEELTVVRIPVPAEDGQRDLCHNGSISTTINFDELYDFPPDDPTVLSIKNVRFKNEKPDINCGMDIPDINLDAAGSCSGGGRKGYSIVWSYDGDTHI